MVDPTEAQKKRADARERRRGRAAKQVPEDRQDGATEHDDEQPLEAVKHAAKVAVAGAAVGAAAAAARALTSRGDDQDSEPRNDEAEPETQPGQQSETEIKEQPEPETEPQAAEPRSEGEDQRDEEPRTPVTDGQPRARESARDAGRRGENELQGAAPEDARATVERAREQLEALLDRPVESVSSFERTRNGWLVSFEVVELSRIPESTDVLGLYEMELDDDRNLMRYDRVRRYYRSQADRGDQA
jgi:hypothetical protein